MTGSKRTNLTTLEVFSKYVGAENLITCYSAEISGFIDFKIKLLAYLMGREKVKIRAETARIVFAAVRRKPVSEPIDFLSRDGRRRCRRRRQTLGNTLKMIVAEPPKSTGVEYPPFQQPQKKL